VKEEEKRWNGKKSFINRMYLDEPNGAVLGINAMLGHDIYFDIENQRIGISATSDCTTTTTTTNTDTT